MKKLYIGSFTVLVALLLVLTGCGKNTSNNSSESSSNVTSTPMSTMQMVASPTVSSPSPTNVPSPSPSNVSSDQSSNVYITIDPGTKLGSDGKLHDAFINGDIKITQGQKVTLHFYNYDDGTHTYTSADLGLNIKIKGRDKAKKGEPAETTFTFTPDKTGTFAWLCADPCDGGKNAQWAMSQDGYMKGHITVLPSTNKTQYISLVVNPGYKNGPDGKLHDAFTPADFTILKGQPVELTVYNFDDGQHTVTNADLKLNLAVKGSAKAGDPGISTVTFSADKAGVYAWLCAIPCDGENGQWSMTHDGYMKGNITVQ